MHPAKHLRVLVVEDDPRLRRHMHASLSRRGCRVVGAAALAEAREAIESADFDVALLDLVLPDGRSEALIPALRRQASNPAIVVITGHLDAEIAVNLSLECDVVIPKPVEFATVLDAIDNATGHARLRQVIHGYCDHAGLSEREEEVLWGAVRGLSNKELTDEIGVTEGSIRTYWTRILAKTEQDTQRNAITAVLRFTFRA